MADPARRWTAFNRDRLIASGDPAQVVRQARALVDKDDHASVLIFDDTTARLVDVDLRGTAKNIASSLAKLNSEASPDDVIVASDNVTPRGPGRPKLGVVPREVTLLPRHWAWLNSQPGGASVALRKLVERARHENESEDRMRRAREAVYRFMSAMAGDRAGYEEALRALFAGDRARFDALVQPWPKDIRDYVKKLAVVAS